MTAWLVLPIVLEGRAVRQAAAGSLPPSATLERGAELAAPRPVTAASAAFEEPAAAAMPAQPLQPVLQAPGPKLPATQPTGVAVAFPDFAEQLRRAIATGDRRQRDEALAGLIGNALASARIEDARLAAVEVHDPALRDRQHVRIACRAAADGNAVLAGAEVQAISNWRTRDDARRAIDELGRDSAQRPGRSRVCD